MLTRMSGKTVYEATMSAERANGNTVSLSTSHAVNIVKDVSELADRYSNRDVRFHYPAVLLILY
jgi:hypothetical protein